MTQPHKFEVRYLQEADIPAFMQLQASVPEDKKHFVKPRTAEDLSTHLGAPMPIVGVYNEEGTLVAGALLTYPKYADESRFLDGYPLNDTTAVLQSVVSVQKGAFSVLMDTAKELAQMNGYTTLIAKVNAENICGVNGFGRNEFEIIDTTPDPLGGNYTAHFMRAVVGFTQAENLRPIILVAASEGPPHELDLQVYQPLIEENPAEFQPEHI